MGFTIHCSHFELECSKKLVADDHCLCLVQKERKLNGVSFLRMWTLLLFCIVGVSSLLRALPSVCTALSMHPDPVLFSFCRMFIHFSLVNCVAIRYFDSPVYLGNIRHAKLTRRKRI